ncbi:MAG: hypothetical protein JST40_11485 [Armatimonadetes bacterium]|nr:hypothetical protein [Armatimonadota bacterium]
MDIVPFGGWDRCGRLVAGPIELFVTLDVGPRIMRFGTIGGPNLLANYSRHAGLTGGESYRSYGGHRLWAGPEDAELTYVADNEPVSISEGDGWVNFTTAEGSHPVKKSISIFPDADYERFFLIHTLTNGGDEPLTLAPWAITVVAPGGECLFPRPPFKPHTEELLPAGPLVTWHYTDMADPRWTWGSRVVRLRQDQTAETPQKAGAYVPQGYAAYHLEGNLFFKRFSAIPGAPYPDFGCNFETFTRHDMLEVESLGALVTLQPGESASHREAWYLETGVELPEDDEALYEYLERLASSHPLE